MAAEEERQKVNLLSTIDHFTVFWETGAKVTDTNP